MLVPKEAPAPATVATVATVAPVVEGVLLLLVVVMVVVVVERSVVPAAIGPPPYELLLLLFMDALRRFVGPTLITLCISSETKQKPKNQKRQGKEEQEQCRKFRSDEGTVSWYVVYQTDSHHHSGGPSNSVEPSVYSCPPLRTRIFFI